MATAQAAGALRRFPHSRRHGCCRCSPRRRAVACRSTPQRTRAATPRRTSPPLAAASSSRSSSCAWVRRWGFPTATASPRSTQCRRLFPPWASLRAPPHLLQPFSLFLSSLSPPPPPPPPPAFLHSSAVRLSGERRPVAVASAATPLEDREASGVDARPDGVGLPAVQATVQPRRPEHGSQAPLPPLRTLRVLAVLAAPRRDPEVRLDTRGTLVRPLRARRFRKLKPKHLSAGLLI
jgi:hypothetical protein